MKLLCLVSALDLRFRYGCTPAWWQFFKGLYELGHDVIAVPYQGEPVESPWWRVYENPCLYEGKAFGKVKSLFGSGATSTQGGFTGQVAKGLIDNWVRPRWETHIADILERERNVDAVIVFTIPLSHLSGIAERLRGRFGVPFFYYDGDVPASLPRFGGFASGFKVYEGASLREYNGVLCNSEGGAADLRELGAGRVAVVHWGVDPALYTPMAIEPEYDVFFYGFGIEFRERWIQAMLTEASDALPDRRFAIGGRNFPMDLRRVKLVGDVPFSVFREACARSRINLNITREAHASVPGSSSMRPFELAAMGCCIVSNPHAGIENWFDPGTEIAIVHSAEEALDAYRRLLADEPARRAMGEAARKRVLREHTHRHRAEQIAAFVASEA